MRLVYMLELLSIVIDTSIDEITGEMNDLIQVIKKKGIIPIIYQSSSLERIGTLKRLMS